MYRKNELLLELEYLDYDLGTKNMELQGLYKKYQNMKKSIIYYICPFFIMILFYMLTIGNEHMVGIGEAFVTVLNPIYLVIGFSYMIFVIRQIWIVYCNGNSKRARKIAKKHLGSSISGEIEKCTISITKIEIKMKEINDELLKFEDNLI